MKSCSLTAPAATYFNLYLCATNPAMRLKTGSFRSLVNMATRLDTDGAISSASSKSSSSESNGRFRFPDGALRKTECGRGKYGVDGGSSEAFGIVEKKFKKADLNCISKLANASNVLDEICSPRAA